MNSKKKIMWFVSLVILVLSFLTIVAKFPYKTYYGYDLKMSWVILISTLLALYTDRLEEKTINIMFVLITIFGYIYNIVFILDQREKIVNFGSEDVVMQATLGAGFYLLLLSCIVVGLSMVLKPGDGKKIKNKAKEIKKDIKDIKNGKKFEEPKKVKRDYLFGSYVFGLKKKPEYYKKPTIIHIKGNELIIAIGSKPVKTIIVDKSNITDIKYKDSLVPKKSYLLEPDEGFREINDYTEENKLVKLEWIDFSKVKGDYLKIYEIEISYKKSKKNQKVMIQTIDEPEEFVKKLETKKKENKSK